jgi:hypothetical protein
MRKDSDPQDWHLQPGPQGWWIIDEYGEDIAFAGYDFDHAKSVLDGMVADEIEARAQEYEPPDPMAHVEFPFADNH